MGATFDALNEQKAAAVSIHAPVMGATLPRYQLQLEQRFNPRTRDGCDTQSRVNSHFVRVSIHAPVMGATKKDCGRRCLLRFNPRTRDGCDTCAIL